VISGSEETVAVRLIASRDGVADLRRELNAIADSTALVPDDEHDAEGATIGFERARVSALLAVRERHVVDLEDALARIRVGTYNDCERCGHNIGLERLAALPATRLCVACASHQGVLRHHNTG
jgi:RNA polymerase-binding transcription factor DksA